MEAAIRNNEIVFEKKMSSGKADIPPAHIKHRLDVVTVMANLGKLGYWLDKDGLAALMAMEKKELAGWWKDVSKTVKSITFEDRNMSDFVVYKNFPKEVLDMNEAGYWVRQILIYIGADPAHLQDEPLNRGEHDDQLPLKVLRSFFGTDLDYAKKVIADFQDKPKSLTDPEVATLKKSLSVINAGGGQEVNISDFRFKKNGATAAMIVEPLENISLVARDATDALRLAQTLSRPKLNKKTNQPHKMGALSRPHRRLVCGLLESSHDLSGDVSRRMNEFKDLFRAVRPGDFKSERVMAAYDEVYNGRTRKAQSGIEAAIRERDVAGTVRELSELPAGLRIRRFREVYAFAPEDALSMAYSAMPEINTHAVLSFISNLRYLNEADNRIITPGGEWKKAQIVKNDGVKISDEHLNFLSNAADDLISSRLEEFFPHGIRRGDDFDGLMSVKLPENGQQHATYGRGTVFDLPEDTRFLRASTYWEQKSIGHVWFDIGLSFFDEGFGDGHAVCWNNPNAKSTNGERYDFAVFSGDPANAYEMKGRACQMIDAYPEKRSGSRYAVMNALCYSGISFAKAKERGEVLVTLQVGNKPEKGKLYDPSRAMFSFSMEREAMTSNVAMIDMEENKVIYLDVDLGGHTHSAMNNIDFLKEKLPLVVEKFSFAPSWHDLLDTVPENEAGYQVGYSDDGFISEKALSFTQTNPDAEYEKIALNTLLSSSGGGYSREHKLNSDEIALGSVSV